MIACDSISGLGHFHGAHWLSGKKLRSKLLAAVDDGMISPCVVIALCQQHRTFFRPIWSATVFPLQGGPLARSQPRSLLRNAMSCPRTLLMPLSISLIVN